MTFNGAYPSVALNGFLLAIVLLLAAVCTLSAPGSQAHSQTCTGAYDPPTPTDVAVTAVPIVVASTTSDYFVLYASHDVDGGTVWYPVQVIRGEDGTTKLAENVAPLSRERYRVEKYSIANPADVDGDCTDDVAELADSAGMNPISPTIPIETAHGTLAVPDRETFEALAYHAPSGTLHVKFSIVDKDTERPRVYFQDTNRFQHHDDFLNSIDIDWDYSTTAKGMIIYDPELISANGRRGLYRYYYQGRVRERPFHSLAPRVYTLLAANMPVLEDNLAMWIHSGQLKGIQAELPLYRASRMNLVFDDDVYGETTFQALNPGEGYGLLRSLDPDERPHSRDVVIYEALPNELPRVAGIISTVPQTPLSHVNLRALQDRVPNAFIASALEDDDISDLIGSHVHYVVTDSGYSVRAATQAEVDEHFVSSRPAEAQTPQRDLTVTSITPLSEIGFEDWDSFGVKAANVAVLGTLGFPDGTVPDGFAVPFYFYDGFMKHNELYDDVREMLADSDFQTDYDTKVDELKKLRKKIKKAETPEWIETALNTMHATFPEGASLRYRSSTNNEDLPGFNGAGLYDSKTQHPEETEEDGISKSLKQVYASLWNFRAFTERDFHRIDHLAAAMGVLVHPNYSDERVNGVAVSVDPAYGTDGTYYVNSQVGEDLVTNPEAHSVPEEVLLYPDGTYAVAALSNQVSPGQMLMTGDQLGQLRRHLAVIQERFADLYGIEDSERFAMEIEFKITSDNVLAIKQARPWIFASPPTALDNALAEDPGVALTASLEDPPATHDGNPFSVRFQFSEFITFRDPRHAVTVMGGRVTAWPQGGMLQGNSLKLQVTPDSPIPNVTLVLAHNRPCTISGAFCTYSGRRLSNRLEHTVESLLPRAPNRPTGRTLASDTVELEWNDVFGADFYEVQLLHGGQWIDLPANGTEIAFDGDGAVVRGLPPSHAYIFRVRAVNSYRASEWSPHLFVPIRLDLQSELTAGQDTDILPVRSGHSIYGNLGGTLSPGRFVLEGTTYRVRFLVHSSDGLWLGMDRELPADFTLLVADSYYRGSESMIPNSIDGVEAYWWPATPPDWLGDDPVRVGLTVHPDFPLGSRQKAPVTGYFHSFPTDHDWNEDVIFRINFSEGVATTAAALRDHVLSVSGGTVSSVEAVGDEGKTWAFSVTPASSEPIAVRIEADLDCALPGAICTPDGRRLFNRLELTVEAKEWNPPTGAPTIRGGTVEAGQTLTVDTSGIADADGLTGAAFSYQWELYDGNAYTDIQGATDSTYTLVPADEGKAFRVRVSFTDDAGYEESLTSGLYGSERPYGLSASASDGVVVLNWKLPAGWPYSSMFQILRNRPELGETGPLVHVRFAETTGTSYTDTDVEPGVLYVYRVKGVDPFGYTGEASQPYEIRTAETSPVENNPASGAPTIGGAAQMGETLTADVSNIADADGLSSATFSYQWMSNDGTAEAHIAGATGSTYTLSDDEVGKTIVVRVDYTDDRGNDETLTTASTGTVTLLIWSSTLTVGSSSAQSGYSFPQSTGVLSPGEFSVGVADFIVRLVLTDKDGALTLGLDRELAAPFTLHVGTVPFAYEDAEPSASEDDTGYTYRWHQAGLDWSAGENLGLRMTTPARPLTAVFEDTPQSHDGPAAFTFELRFSEELTLSYKTLRDHGFTVTGATVTKATRLAPPGNVHWEITVLPDSNADVSVVLPVTRDCGDQGAICTGDGRMLSAEVRLTVAGPAGEEGLRSFGNNPATGAPTIVGTARVGATLRVSLSALDDADGLSGAVFSYQWLADDVEIQDATDSIHVLDVGDEGTTIRVRVSFTDDAGNDETLTSEPAAAVAQAKTEEAPTEPPPAPFNLTARANGDGSVTVSWDASDDDSITGYQVLRRHPGEAQHSMVESAMHTGGTETTYTDDDLTPDVLHAYSVRAMNAAGSSERSNYDNAVPHQLVPIDFGLGATTIYLTFDDGPREPHTAQMLDLLEKYGARATFFVTGLNAALHPDVIARMAAARHGIGNHTWQHERLTELSRENFNSTVGRTQEQIGVHATRCLRPPYV